MIIPHAPPPTLRPRKTISSDKDYEQLDRALKDLLKRTNGSMILSNVSTMCAAVTKSSTGAAAICGRGGVKSSQW